MDFEEVPEKSPKVNKAKNRLTLIALATVFVAPVLFAYLAYFGGWFTGGAKSNGTIIDEPWHIEDLNITETTFGEWIDSKYFAKWNWLLILDSNKCDEVCQINYLLLQQTHLGLAKKVEKNDYLLVLNQNQPNLEGEWAEIDYMQGLISNGKLQLNSELRNLNTQPLEANKIYLVDPLGNVFMQYDLIAAKEEAPLYSRSLRSDINRVMRFLDVNKTDE